MVAQATTALNNYHGPMFDRLSEKQQLQIAEALQLIKTTLNR
jgi:hypothetical protein